MNLTATDYSWEYHLAQQIRYEKNTIFVRDRVENILGITPFLKGDRVLDLGCSVGTIMIEVPKFGASCVGLDFSPEALHVAKELFTRYGKGKDLFVRAGADLVCFKDGVFDKIVCADLIEHVDKTISIKILQESFRMLKRKGALIVYTPCVTHLTEILKEHNFILKQDKTHIDVKHPMYLRKSLEDIGFKIKRMYYRPMHWPLLKELEVYLMKIPGIGKFFRKRICILAQKP